MGRQPLYDFSSEICSSLLVFKRGKHIAIHITLCLWFSHHGKTTASQRVWEVRSGAESRCVCGGHGSAEGGRDALQSETHWCSDGWRLEEGKPIGPTIDLWRGEFFLFFFPFLFLAPGHSAYCYFSLHVKAVNNILHINFLFYEEIQLEGLTELLSSCLVLWKRFHRGEMPERSLEFKNKVYCPLICKADMSVFADDKTWKYSAILWTMLL